MIKIIGEVDFNFYSVTCFMESLTLPLSKPITLTFTSSPSLTISVTLAKVTDIVKEGDEVKVKVIGFDRGKVKLSMKQVTE